MHPISLILAGIVGFFVANKIDPLLQPKKELANSVPSDDNSDTTKTDATKSDETTDAIPADSLDSLADPGSVSTTD